MPLIPQYHIKVEKVKIQMEKRRHTACNHARATDVSVHVRVYNNMSLGGGSGLHGFSFAFLLHTHCITHCIHTHAKYTSCILAPYIAPCDAVCRSTGHC